MAVRTLGQFKAVDISQSALSDTRVHRGEEQDSDWQCTLQIAHISTVSSWLDMVSGLMRAEVDEQTWLLYLLVQ